MDKNGSWRSLHNEELHSMYHSPSMVREIRSKNIKMDRLCSQNGKGMSAIKILKGKPTGKRPLERRRRRCENNIRNLNEIGVNVKD